MAYVGSVWRQSERRACLLLGFARSSIRYATRRSKLEDVREKLRSLAELHPRYGYRRLHSELCRAGEHVSRKLVWRLYREEGLKLRPRRKGNRRKRLGPPLRTAVKPGERWAMDFIHDSLRGGRQLRVLSVIDEGSRECPALQVGTSLSGQSVAVVLQRLWETGARPRTIITDNGPEFRSRALTLWARSHGVELVYTDPGRPIQNAFVESFHARFREECLDLHAFDSLSEAREVIGAWRQNYNLWRPHSSLGGLTPAEYGKRERAA